MEPERADIPLTGLPLQRVQLLLFSEQKSSAGNSTLSRLRRFPKAGANGPRVKGRLWREARDYSPDLRPPEFAPQEAMSQLRRMCEYFDDAMEDPLRIERLAVGGITVWFMGLVAFRVSAELAVVAFVENGGSQPSELNDDFNLARPFETIKPFRMMVDCLAPALRSDRFLRLTADQIEVWYNWLAVAARNLLRRDPEFQQLVRTDLPRAIQLPDPIRQLCRALRPRPKGDKITAHGAIKVIENFEVLCRAASENRRLMPLLGALWETPGFSRNGDDPIKQLKSAMLAKGLSNASWRYVCRHGARLFRVVWSLTPYQPAFEVATSYMLALQAAGLPPPPPPVVASAWLRAFNVSLPFSHDIELGADFLTKLNSRVLGIALQEAHRRRNAPNLTDFLPDFLCVCWWGANRQQKIDNNQVGAGWQSLVDHAKADQALEELLSSTSNIRWKTRYSELTMDSWIITPIDNAETLVRASIAMRNCLRDHLIHCATGQHQYLLVRDAFSGKPRYCIGLDRAGSSNYQLRDVKGFGNSKAPEEIVELAMRLLARENFTG